MLEHSLPEELCLWQEPTLEQLLKKWRLWEGATLEQFVKDCIPQEELHTGAEEQHEEGAAGAVCCRLSATPIPHLSLPLGRQT